MDVNKQVDELYAQVEGMHDSLDDHVTHLDVALQLQEALRMIRRLRDDLRQDDVND